MLQTWNHSYYQRLRIPFDAAHFAAIEGLLADHSRVSGEFAERSIESVTPADETSVRALYSAFEARARSTGVGSVRPSTVRSRSADAERGAVRSPDRRHPADVEVAVPDFVLVLDASSAVRIDPGESVTMAAVPAASVKGSTIRIKVVNTPSDATGQRPVGDALLVLPRRKD